ncbi:MAG: TraB/GumN family protein [Phycisphaerae bacterium]|nr:TraB/GumN family protein [Phycisphaerae bacterium]
MRFLIAGGSVFGMLLGLPAARADEAPAPKPATAAPAGELKFDKPFLFAIKGEKRHSFVLGTIHLGDKRMTEMPEVLKSALGAVDGIRTELPMDPATMLGVAGKMARTDGKTLEESIGADLAQRAKTYLEKRGLSFAMVNNVQTMMAGTTLSMMEVPQPEQLPPIDMQVYQYGVDNGLDVGGLETVEEQMSILTGAPEEKQVHLFKVSMDLLEKAEREGTPNMTKLMNAYLSGDLEQVSKVMNEGMDKNDPIQAEFFDKLLKDRNVVMAERMTKLMKENPEKGYLFAIGTAHLRGEGKGVLELLEAQGMKIKQLKPEDASKIKPRGKGA